MERFRQKQMKLDDLTQPGWEDAADFFRERDEKYWTSELSVPAVVLPQTDDDAVAPVPTTLGELMECLVIVHGISQLLQGTSQPGCCLIRLGSGKPQSNVRIPRLAAAAEPDSTRIQKVKPVDLVSFYTCISTPQLIAI